MIYDKTDSQHWSRDVVDWDAAFETGDVVLSAGHASFRTMIVVSEIDLDEAEHVTRRGVFWKKDEAERYADALHDERAST